MKETQQGNQRQTKWQWLGLGEREKRTSGGSLEPQRVDPRFISLNIFWRLLSVFVTSHFGTNQFSWTRRATASPFQVNIEHVTALCGAACLAKLLETLHGHYLSRRSDYLRKTKKTPGILQGARTHTHTHTHTPQP